MAEARDGGLTKDCPLSRFLAWAHRCADSLDATAAPTGPEWEHDEE
jgi:hypothetical protein